MGRPAIPLPTIPYTVPAGQPLHDLVTATEADQIKVTLDSGGKVQITSAGQPLAVLDYTPRTLGNTIDLAEKFIFPRDSSGVVVAPGNWPVLRRLINWGITTTYHFLRFEIAVLLTPA